MAKKKTLKQILIELGAYERFKAEWKKRDPTDYQENAAKVLKSTKAILWSFYNEKWDRRISGTFLWNPWDYWHNICLQVYQMSQ